MNLTNKDWETDSIAVKKSKDPKFVSKMINKWGSRGAAWLNHPSLKEGKAPKIKPDFLKVEREKNKKLEAGRPRYTKSGKLDMRHTVNKENTEMKTFKQFTSQLDELSKKTLGSYVNKANLDMHLIGRSRAQANKNNDEKEKKLLSRLKTNRIKGVSRAINKLTKEETQLDELSRKTIDSYQKQAHAQANNIMKSSLDDLPKSVQTASAKALERRKKGLKTAYKKVGMPEDTQLDELSKDTLKRYNTASFYSGQKHHEKAADRRDRYGKDDKKFEKHARIEHNRFMGRILARKKIAAKENTQLDELSKKTLASYVKKASNNNIGNSEKMTRSSIEAENPQNPHSLRNLHRKNRDAAGRKLVKRILGINKALNKITKD
jgi:hypothetical protein